MTKSREEKKRIYACKVCGVSFTNRATWCDLGCGRDYNEMFEVKNLLQLFRSWALECVGEDLPDPKCSGIQAWFYQNETKQEIRKRIEEKE